MGQLASMAHSMVVRPAQAREIQYEADDGSIISITSDEIRAQICPNATDNEIGYFMEMCRSQRLNPFTKDAYLVKYQNSPAQMIVAHKILLKRAEHHPQFDGMEFGVTVLNRNGEVRHEQRRAVYKAAGETLIGGWCRIYRKDRKIPLYSEVSMDEMSKNQSTWKNMPAIMITKCAQAACIRDAFPDETSGLYSDAEGGQVVESTIEEVKTSATAVAEKAHAKSENPDLIKLRELTDSCSKAGYNVDETKRFLWSKYQEGGIGAAEEAAHDMLSKVEPGVTDVNGDTGEELYETDVEF